MRYVKVYVKQYEKNYRRSFCKRFSDNMRRTRFFTICVTNTKYLVDVFYLFLSLFIHICQKRMTIFRFLTQYIFHRNYRWKGKPIIFLSFPCNIGTFRLFSKLAHFETQTVGFFNGCLAPTDSYSFLYFTKLIQSSQ